MEQIHWILYALFIALLMILAFYAWDEAYGHSAPAGRGQSYHWSRHFERHYDIHRN